MNKPCFSLRDTCERPAIQILENDMVFGEHAPQVSIGITTVVC